MRTPVAALALLALVGCATLARDSFDERFGTADPQRFDQPAAPAPDVVSWRATCSRSCSAAASSAMAATTRPAS